jgi:hypothetical protein
MTLRKLTIIPFVPVTSKNETRLALADIFLPSSTRYTARFDWRFLDFGIVYRVKNKYEELHNPICPAAMKALLDLYKSCPLSQAYINALIQDTMDGNQFEDALFQQLTRLSKIVLETTDLAGKNKFNLNLDIKEFRLLQKPPEKYDKNVLVHCYIGYPRFDFIFGYKFIQVSISDFASHNKDYAKLDHAFERSNGKNQIEEYLDAVFGGIHEAKLDITVKYIKNTKKEVKRFKVLKDGWACTDFEIIYICGKPGGANHTRKVEEYPEIRYISYEEIKPVNVIIKKSAQEAWQGELKYKDGNSEVVSIIDSKWNMFFS